MKASQHALWSRFILNFAREQARTKLNELQEGELSIGISRNISRLTQKCHFWSGDTASMAHSRAILWRKAPGN